ncbi:hypothetical protein ES703_124511 [subsurface metagenome]
MISLINWFMASIKRERGATAIEYALMVALIAAVIVTVVGLLGGQIQTAFQAMIDAF